MTLQLTHTGYHNREYTVQLMRGQLVGGRSGSALLDPMQRNECEVTCKIENQRGETCMYNAIFKFKGAPVLGVELDHEAEFNLEYGRPEGDLVIINFRGRVHKVRAWITTADGPLVVLESTFQNSLDVKEGDAIPVVGPQLRYVL